MLLLSKHSTPYLGLLRRAAGRRYARAAGAAAAYAPYFGVNNGHHLSPPSASSTSPQQQQNGAVMTQEPMSFLGEPVGGLGAIPDMGFTEDVLMSEQWMNRMRGTGILDSSGNFAGVQNGAFLPQELMF